MKKNYKLTCSDCKKEYRLSDEEQALYVKGDLALIICNDCCVLKDEPINYTFIDQPEAFQSVSR